MPGYDKISMYTAPSPTDEVDTVEKRFVMPNLTIAQIVILSAIIAYAYSARKMNGAIISTMILAVALLHAYDHVYLVKLCPERELL